MSLKSARPEKLALTLPFPELISSTQESSTVGGHCGPRMEKRPPPESVRLSRRPWIPTLGGDLAETQIGVPASGLEPPAGFWVTDPGSLIVWKRSIATLKVAFINNCTKLFQK